MSAAAELQLISARTAGKDTTESSLVYRLDEAKNLPDVHQAHPWAGKKISALRDRLMIEWVLSFPESSALLKRMADEICVALRKSSREREPGTNTVRVVVVCGNGAHLSPCFVEKLYEHFSSGPSIIAGLVVTRYHRDALKGDWGRSKDIVWQVSCVPTHQKLSLHFAEVFRATMWLNFDPTANAQSEALFRKDPFNPSVDFTDMILDFASGTAYRKTEKKNYYIRCTDVPQSKADCWMLTDAGYKSSSRSFRAAGIQPYSVHPVTGEAVFLLGKLTYGPLIWCDFGGFKSSRFSKEGPRLTAARECYEETLGVLGTMKQLSDALLDFKTNNCFKVVNAETEYVSHFLRIPYREYPALFKKRLREGRDSAIEVEKLRWFPLSSLKSAVMIACSKQYGVTQHHISVKALTENGSVDESCSHRLREPYVATLCIADALNFLDSISAIAKHQHRKLVSHTTVPPQPVAHSLSGHEELEETEGASALTEDTYKPEYLLEKGIEGLSPDVGPTSDTYSDQGSETVGKTEGDESETPTDGDTGDDSGSSEGDESAGEPSSSDSYSVDYSEASRTSTNESQHKEKSTSSQFKSKLVKVMGRKKNRHKHHHDDTASGNRHSKLSKKHKRCLYLYGMGAGSFTAIESYMNT